MNDYESKDPNRTSTDETFGTTSVKKKKIWLIGGGLALLLALSVPLALSMLNRHAASPATSGLSKPSAAPASAAGSTHNTASPTNTIPPASTTSATTTAAKHATSAASTTAADTLSPFQHKTLGLSATFPADMQNKSDDYSFYLSRGTTTVITGYFTYVAAGPMYSVKDFSNQQEENAKAALERLHFAAGWSISDSSDIQLGGRPARKLSIKGGLKPGDLSELYVVDCEKFYGCYVFVVVQDAKDPDLQKHKAQNQAFMESLKFDQETGPASQQGIVRWEFSDNKRLLLMCYDSELVSSKDQSQAGASFDFIFYPKDGNTDSYVVLSSPDLDSTDELLSAFRDDCAAKGSLSNEGEKQARDIGINNYATKELDITDAKGIKYHAICAVSWFGNLDCQLVAVYSDAEKSKILSQFDILARSLVLYDSN